MKHITTTDILSTCILNNNTSEELMKPTSAATKIFSAQKWQNDNNCVYPGRDNITWRAHSRGMVDLYLGLLPSVVLNPSFQQRGCIDGFVSIIDNWERIVCILHFFFFILDAVHSRGEEFHPQQSGPTLLASVHQRLPTSLAGILHRLDTAPECRPCLRGYVPTHLSCHRWRCSGQRDHTNTRGSGHKVIQNIVL